MKPNGLPLEPGSIVHDGQHIACHAFTLDFDSNAWEEGWAVEDNGAIPRFPAAAYNEWNKRLVIGHFYVDRPYRRRDPGRTLMDLAGATTAWLETALLPMRNSGLRYAVSNLSLFAIYLTRPIQR